MSESRMKEVELMQTPSPGGWLLRFCGEAVEFRLKVNGVDQGQAYLRTNLGNAGIRRREIIEAVEKDQPRLETDWFDIPMTRVSTGEYVLTMTLGEVGVFEAKTFFRDSEAGEQYWPEGDNISIKVEPASFAAANTVYTAFVRQFGSNKERGAVQTSELPRVEELEGQGYTVIPCSGTFRELIRELDFIIGELGFRIIQLLPIHPVPTTFARMGRFGSPFASLDFMDVDRALADFDRQTTPLEQFNELIQEVHARDGRVLMDIPVNHTGWASNLQIHHPEWFPRTQEGTFRSPGAWGVIWEDLSELDYSHVSLWQFMADVFLFWCEQGVDGFRCDAGYKVPFDVWEYVVAKVRQIYPETVFLLEGLGGELSTTRRLIGDAGLNWAYSELFQNYDRGQVEQYLPVSQEMEGGRGLLVQYAETHDNDRLAASGEVFSQMRAALCALCSMGGMFGITNGVEWFADEKVDVHGAPSLNWGAEHNQVDWLRRLNAIVSYHPALQAKSKRRMVHTGEGNSIALLREAADADEHLLILVNLSADSPQVVYWYDDDILPADALGTDLLHDEKIAIETEGNVCRRELQPGEVRCIAREPWDAEGWENEETFASALDEWRFRAKYVELAKCIQVVEGGLAQVPSEEQIRRFMTDPVAELQAWSGEKLPLYVHCHLPEDLRRVVLVPRGMLLLVSDSVPVMLTEKMNGEAVYSDRSLCAGGDFHFIVLPPSAEIGESEYRRLEFRRFVRGVKGPDVARGNILRLGTYANTAVKSFWSHGEIGERQLGALAVNARASMAYVRAPWAEIRSQYDCFLGVNPALGYPGERRIMWTRCRCWLVYWDYSRELSFKNLRDFYVAPGSRSVWRFDVPLGRGYVLPLRIELTMVDSADRVNVRFVRDSAEDDSLEPAESVFLIVRPDIEDRNFHEKTKAFRGAEDIFPKAVEHGERGFRFTPSDHTLTIEADAGAYVEEPEWQYMVEHPLEKERGLEEYSDLFSPGYFWKSLERGDVLALTGEAGPADVGGSPRAGANIRALFSPLEETEEEPAKMPIEDAAEKAACDFVVERDSGATVIAGYPWFLDWGRDTFICLRGMTAMGGWRLVQDILMLFARFEEQGTLPNMIHGEEAANRDTSDAPLWFVVACRDLVRAMGSSEILEADCDGRTLRDVLVSIIEHYRSETPNGIGMDPESALIYSPNHFTWMDTQYPSGTPRAGYPVEIQALWAAALGFMTEVCSDEAVYREIYQKVSKSVQELFVRANGRGLVDCLHAEYPGARACDCRADDHLRPNQLFAVTLENILPEATRKQVVDACWTLLVPGAIRTLADQPVEHELPVHGAGGNLLNDPKRPYQGVYAGDEDTCRKPAYHNGTAWTWVFPSFCEGLMVAYGSEAVDMALDILSSTSGLFNDGCAGHLPEIVDGDAPHAQRGCGAQAWSATEVARVARLLRGFKSRCRGKTGDGE